MAEFKVTVEAVWQKDGTFEEIGHGGLLVAQDDANETESENEDME